MRFETAAGFVDAEILDQDLVRIAMPDPKGLDGDFVVAGVPHMIVPVDNLAKTDVDGEGRRIRLSDEFAPDGTNVDFVTYRAPDRVAIRTYERGLRPSRAERVPSQRRWLASRRTGSGSRCASRQAEATSSQSAACRRTRASGR